MNSRFRMVFESMKRRQKEEGVSSLAGTLLICCLLLTSNLMDWGWRSNSLIKGCDVVLIIGILFGGWRLQHKLRVKRVKRHTI